MLIYFLTYYNYNYNYIYILIGPFGSTSKNENKASDMIDIVSCIHQYVPTVPNIHQKVLSTGVTVDVDQSSFHNIIFGGDQLTCTRARSAIVDKVNSQKPCRRFFGIEPVIEDWQK